MSVQIMAYFAQTKLESIRQRQAKRIASVKAKWKHLGRNAISKAILITTDRIRYYMQMDKMLQSEIKRLT